MPSRRDTTADRENPHRIDEVPVEADGYEIGDLQRGEPAHEPGKARDDHNSDCEVEAVQPCHHPIQRPEHGRAPFGDGEARIREEMAAEVFAPLIAFDGEKRRSEQRGNGEAFPDEPAQAGPAALHRHHHREAAGQQDHRIDRPKLEVRLAGASQESIGMGEAIDGVTKEQAAEEEHFRAEKQPHAEARGFLLVLNRLPLFGDCGLYNRKRGVVDGNAAHRVTPC